MIIDYRNMYEQLIEWVLKMDDFAFFIILFIESRFIYAHVCMNMNTADALKSPLMEINFILLYTYQ